MPLSDLLLVFQWWGTLFLVGAVAYPVTASLFDGWFDKGFFFTKAVGMAVVTFLVYIGAMAHVVPFTQGAVWGAMGITFVIGLFTSFQLHKKISPNRENAAASRKKELSLFIVEELFFFGALLFWAWVKAHEPSIHALEKYMDFGFTKSILDSRYFPAPDMWYAGYPINYYYFGHTVMAVLTKVSGIDLTQTFNLMLATIFALCATMSFAIGVQLLRIRGAVRTAFQVGGGILTAFLVTIAGNMQTIYAFTRGYTGDAVKPFWTLAWSLKDIGGVRGVWDGTLFAKIGEGMNTYWYANATRFIPYTIHEFPGYSFVVSDVHGHVLSIPFVLLTIGLLITIFCSTQTHKNFQFSIFNFQLIFYGFLCGVLLMTNALDGPIYLALFIFTLGLSTYLVTGTSVRKWRDFGVTAGVVVFSATLASLPFLTHFKSFVNGIAVNCPPTLVSNTKMGPLIFEGVEKCQHSPLWMWWLLWGFFVYCGLWFIVMMHQRVNASMQDKKKHWFAWLQKLEPHELLLLMAFVFFVLLLVFPEFFYFKDIYPMHFRANTMFKLGYQAYMMLSIIAAFAIVTMAFEKIERSARKLFNKKTIFFVLLAPQLFLVSIFPIFSVRSYFNSLKTYVSIFGMGWFEEQYPDDWAGIQWLNANASSVKCQVSAAGGKQALTRDTCDKSPVIVEAAGDSYTDFNAYSAFSGLPTIVGWAVHEWLWRGSFDVVSPRQGEVQEIYESTDIPATQKILTKYDVRFVIVGTFERQKYKNLQEQKINQLGKPVFTQGNVTIYQII